MQDLHMKYLVTFSMIAIAISGTASAKDKSDEVAADPEKKICKSFLDTGSRLNKTRICKTAAEWTEDRDENTKVLREKRGNQGAPQLGNGG
jgi:hypothetical protein